MLCEQRCGEPAQVYAIDPIPNGWGGRYCLACAAALSFQIVDHLTNDDIDHVDAHAYFCTCDECQPDRHHDEGRAA